jgi:hypothetical protein
MGTLDHGINGPFRGKTGEAVGSKGKSKKNLVRARPRKTTKSKKKKLLSQHHNLGMMSSFLSLAREYIEIGFYNKKNKDDEMTLAMKYNLAHAIITRDDGPEIDYAEVKFSIGRRERVWSEQVEFTPGRIVKGSWDVHELLNMKVLGNDRAMVIMYDVDDDRLRYIKSEPVRSDLSYEYKLAPESVGHVIHVWVFLVSPDGKEVSDSDYLGSGTVLE